MSVAGGRSGDGIAIVLATANPDKAKDIVDIMAEAAVGVRLVPRPDHVGEVDETGDTLVANARLKAAALAEATGLPALADDTGLEVDALGGAPGVWSARYAGDDATYADNVAKLLRELDARPARGGDRRARFRTVAMLRHPDGRELWREGVVEGYITTEARGTNGFGYDPVFVPDEGDGRTFAEMRPEEKHAVSHRGRAVRALTAALASWLPA